MKCDVIHGGELTEELINVWSRLHSGNRMLASPYFHPGFTQIVAEVRDDTFVGVIRDGSAIVGFFPFHRGRMGQGRPVGLALSDYHGVIVDPGLEWSVADLLRDCSLTCFDFDHLLQGQAEFASYISERMVSPIVDVSGGYAAWESMRMKMGGKQIKEIRRRSRKMAREVGEARFVREVRDPSVLAQLIAWKSEQCQRTGSVDYFSLGWPRELVERIHGNQFEGFGSVLSALYLEDTLLAAHFCMRSSTVWHSWFPGYNAEFGMYSAGLNLELAMIKAAGEEDVEYIDLGKGMSPYKKIFMTDTIAIAEGRIELPSIARTVRAARRRLEQWVRGSSLAPLARIPRRLITNWERSKRYE